MGSDDTQDFARNIRKELQIQFLRDSDTISHIF